MEAQNWPTQQPPKEQRTVAIAAVQTMPAMTVASVAPRLIPTTSWSAWPVSVAVAAYWPTQIVQIVATIAPDYFPNNCRPTSKNLPVPITNDNNK